MTRSPTIRAVPRPGRWWIGPPPPISATLNVIAPHPDDEILGAAGIMMWAHEQGCELRLVAVTDGEGSHARSSAVDSDELRQIRAAERRHALDALGVDDVDVIRLRYPDGAVLDHVHRLRADLERVIGPDETVLIPARADHHPDHHATWLASRHAAVDAATLVYEIPIWARVTQVAAPTASRVLHLDERRHRRKRDAVACYRSQLQPLGPGPFDGPVLDAATVAAMSSDTEWLLP